MKNLYHGSISLFDTIDLRAGKGYKDFGRGFYATAVASHAEKLARRNKEIAVRRQELLSEKNKSFHIAPVIAYATICFSMRKRSNCQLRSFLPQIPNGSVSLC